MEICSKEQCTACGACAYVCPKQCIHMREDELGEIYPSIDEEICVQCGKCRKICPALYSFEFLSPQKAFAAWSSNPEERRTSASGGIAAELYKYALVNDMSVIGAKMNPDFSCSLELVDSVDQIQEFKNSKYVFSTAYELYPKLAKTLSMEKGVVMIGLPCQIAAVKRFFPHAENLYLIDVVCHGTTSSAYLKQHIRALELFTKREADKICFRDPYACTYTYTLTLTDKKNVRFYTKRTKDGDSYQIGYHRGISYRENCYHCKYAKGERIADLTLGDYKGLGKMAPWSDKQEEVSCVLIHSEKGKHIFEELIDNGRIVAFERPVNEPISADSQLQHSSIKSRARLDFEKHIKNKHGDFEKAMKAVIIRKQIRDYCETLLRKCKKYGRLIKKKFSEAI